MKKLLKAFLSDPGGYIALGIAYLLIGIVVVVVVLGIISLIATCAPYYFRPFIEAPLICVPK